MAERKRIAVPISGIDTSTPDHSVTDGKCETLHNLRYTGEAWRNMKGFEDVEGTIDIRAIEATTDSSENLLFTNFYEDRDYIHPIVGSYVYSKDSNTDIVTYIGRVINIENSVYTIRHEEGYDMSRKLSNINLITLYDGEPYIIYKHEDRYIGYFTHYRDDDVNNDFLHMIHQLVYDSEAKAFYPTNLICSAIFDDSNKHLKSIFHFGNIIHFEWDDDNEPQWYLFSEGKYVLYQIDDIYFELSETIQTDIPDRKEIDSTLGLKIEGDTPTQLYDYVVRAADLSNYQTLLRTYSSDEAWRGSICYFLAARAEDGSILAQSPLRILSSSSAILPVYQNSDGTIYTGSQIAAGLGTYDLGGRLYAGINCGGGLEPFESLSDYQKTQMLATHTSPSTMYIKPTISFNIKDTIGEFSANIFDVALYCTRIHPLFTIASMAQALPAVASIPTLNNYVSARNAYAAEDLPNEPFFLAAKKTIKDLRYTTATSYGGEFILDRTILENIESKGTLYEPQLSEHDISSSHRKDINNSLHLFGDITTHFRKAYSRAKEMATPQLPADYDPDDYENWLNKPELKYIRALIKTQENIYQSPLAAMQNNSTSHPFLFQCGSILSYPDYRAFEILFAETESSGDYTYKAAKYQLKSAPGINYAYYIPPYGGTETAPGADLKYPTIWPFQDADYDIYETDSHPTSIITKGKVWASKNNNPTALPFERSYTIGSSTNEILAVNSAAIEMSDSKFGEFPLYVFTKEGIFAMQSGKETLYSAIVPINYDVIINPNTLAVNGAVLYFTDKGLHALTNQGAKLLSQPIHTEENRIPDWMYTCQMVYMPEWSEVLCIDLPRKKAYVFSLDNNVWSTCDIPEGYILNNDELVATDNIIYNLRNEKEQGSDGVSISLTTRPIKLGSMELKRAETIIVRFECPTNQTLNVKVEGSIDTQNWGELRNIQATTNKDILIRRTPCSVKYLRFTIEGNVTDDIRILAFELEYYERMRHRMR